MMGALGAQLDQGGDTGKRAGRAAGREWGRKWMKRWGCMGKGRVEQERCGSDEQSGDESGAWEVRGRGAEQECWDGGSGKRKGGWVVGGKFGGWGGGRRWMIRVVVMAGEGGGRGAAMANGGESLRSLF
ncbi:hypothetical protein ACH5RR_000711 [Cinchona calisaya]|uniref:Uncharacterized protein n=1 Tax=Cinchona calisaya TaxID=153742 RepID=A0ABD3B1E4_9GENT